MIYEKIQNKSLEKSLKFRKNSLLCEGGRQIDITSNFFFLKFILKIIA